MQLVVDVSKHQRTIELISDFGVTFSAERWSEICSSNSLFLAFLNEENRNIALAFFRYSIFDHISSIFVVVYRWSDEGFADKSLFFIIFLLNDSFSLFFRQGVKSFLLLLIHHLVFRNLNVCSSDFNSEFISSCCTILSISITSLNIEKSFRLNVIVF